MRILALSFLALAACATAPANAQTTICEHNGVSVSVDFPSGGRHTCRIDGDGEIILAVIPEGEPINPSPWYAFRLDAAARARVRVVLDYGTYEHRYAPDMTRDGATWTMLAPRDVLVANDQHRATLRLNLEPGTTYISAQPIVTPDAMHAWARSTLSRAGGFEEVRYGSSIDGRPLIGYRGGTGTELIVAITRQHPPETTGATAFRAFVERLMADDPKANAFRARHRILLAPAPNPDGVMRGHWRWNNGGVDLNRDWDNFVQPETRALRDLILSEAQGRTTVAFMDFHSTRNNAVYAPPLSTQVERIDFLPLLKQRLDAVVDHELPWEYSHNPNGNTSKRWSLEALRVPGMTLEFDDAATEATARRIGTAVAEALRDYQDGVRAR